MSRWGETFAALSGGSDTLDTIRHSGDPLSIVSQRVNSVTAAPTPSVPSIPPAVDRALAIWGEAEAERAVIVGDEGAIPRIGIPEIPEEPVLLRDGRSLGSVATTARLIMIAQSRHLMPVLSATTALVLLTLSTLSQARAAQSGTDVAPSTTKPEAPQPSYLEPLNADESAAILGKKVVGLNGEDLGMITDLIVDRAGRPRAVVIDFGGFLGAGSRKVAVD
jgi:hypothetical protein